MSGVAIRHAFATNRKAVAITFDDGPNPVYTPAIGNHTYTHPYLTRLDEESCRSELLRTHKSIEALAGQPPRSFRPPYFDCDGRVADIAANLGYSVIGAVNGAARDWEQPGVRHIVESSRASVKPGCVLLFHDGFGDRSQTVEAVRQLVTELAAEGYELVTVSELAHPHR
ncbi:polysaccharide deacetylase family protein [Cohnella thermotolerans]|uniref:polysaccharide deacetylase family protein n=1 Tax=Cohnella thermotolerans TaxID=329858 RepID=UPI00040BF827|nr:polysaccharide deacetylase family protein [Cohnella thermotolerans]